ncbi:MAG: YihY family inner membrane protein [Halioglobus sp.]|nr:YihY family inner membrane protein [Halioglobus sp.]
MDKFQQVLRELWQRLSYVASRYSVDRCSENAAALTYMSLFALVPLLTVLYTMASAIPAFQGAESQMQAFLFTHLVPESSSEIEQYLSDFSQQAKNLTGPGIAFVLITAVLMLRNIEKAFNLIWRARENRNPVASFLLYWAVLTLAPITIGLALGLGTYVETVSHTLERYDFVGARSILLQFAPLALSTAGFSLVYVAVPNCQVPFRHALVGGLLAALVFDIGRGVFTDLMVRSSISSIYGAFAAVPLFMFWIYLSWNIVLMGGILVHSLSAYQDSTQASRPNVLKALDVLYLFWQKQAQGLPVSEKDLLRGRHAVVSGLDSDTWSELRDIFLAHRLITQNDRGQYLLSRDLHGVQFVQLKAWVNDERPLDRADLAGDLDWQARAYNLLQSERANQRDILNINLAELFSQ